MYVYYYIRYMIMCESMYAYKRDRVCVHANNYFEWPLMCVYFVAIAY